MADLAPKTLQHVPSVRSSAEIGGPLHPNGCGAYDMVTGDELVGQVFLGIVAGLENLSVCTWSTPDRTQIDPISTLDRHQIDIISTQIDPRSTPIDRGSTLDRSQIDPRYFPDRIQIEPRSSPYFMSGTTQVMQLLKTLDAAILQQSAMETCNLVHVPAPCCFEPNRQRVLRVDGSRCPVQLLCVPPAVVDNRPRQSQSDDFAVLPKECFSSRPSTVRRDAQSAMVAQVDIDSSVRVAVGVEVLEDDAQSSSKSSSSSSHGGISDEEVEESDADGGGDIADCIAASPAAVLSPWEQVHLECGLTEHKDILYLLDGRKVGVVQFIHGSTLSVKAICCAEGHKQKVAAAPGSLRKCKHVECYLLLHAIHDCVEKYKICCQWLVDAHLQTGDEHRATGIKMKEELKAAAKAKKKS